MVARVAQDIGCGPDAVEKLVRLARKAFRAGEYYASVDDKGAERMLEHRCARVELFAASLGLDTRWPGLWPVFEKNGVPVHLPD